MYVTAVPIVAYLEKPTLRPDAAVLGTYGTVGTVRYR